MNSQKRYSPEVRERAVRMVLEHQDEYESQWAAMGSIAEKQTEIKDEAIAESKAAATTMVATTWGVAGVSVLLGAGIAFWLIRSISGGLGRVVRYAERVAEKDLTAGSLDVTSNDEIGRLAESMVSVHGVLRQVLGDVARATREVAGAATQISASNEHMATGMVEQTREIEQICGAVTQMSASVEEVAGRAGAASENAKTSGESAREGGQIVERTIGGMRAIDEAVSGGAASVQELGRRSEQIGAIIETINDIAEQTNLLALNAAIEAARHDGWANPSSVHAAGRAARAHFEQARERITVDSSRLTLA